jgi:hypothetical protein
LNDSHRLNYFLTFTPLKHTPNTMADLLQVIGFWHINIANLPQAVDYGHGEILTFTSNHLGVLSLLPFL